MRQMHVKIRISFHSSVFPFFRLFKMRVLALLCLALLLPCADSLDDYLLSNILVPDAKSAFQLSWATGVQTRPEGQLLARIRAVYDIDTYDWYTAKTNVREMDYMSNLIFFSFFMY